MTSNDTSTNAGTEVSTVEGCLLDFTVSSDNKSTESHLYSIMEIQTRDSYIAGLLTIRGKKSEISRDLKRQIRGENGRFRGIFAGIFGPNFH